MRLREASYRLRLDSEVTGKNKGLKQNNPITAIIVLEETDVSEQRDLHQERSHEVQEMLQSIEKVYGKVRIRVTMVEPGARCGINGQDSKQLAEQRNSQTAHLGQRSDGAFAMITGLPNTRQIRILLDSPENKSWPSYQHRH